MKLSFGALAVLMMLVLSGCASYTQVTRIGKNTVAVSRNDNLLFGLLRGPQVWICQVTAQGLKGCVTGDNP